MSDIRYREAFQIRPASNYSKSGKKKKKKKGMSRRQEYDGIISNTNLDSYSTHIGEKALRSFASDARNGVPVLALHDRNTQIGRSTGGRYSSTEKNVSSEFYIQRGLPLNGPGYGTTDAYIDSVDEGTMRDLSVGFVPKLETCDYCDSEMKRYSFLGMSFSECQNGHYPGQTIYVDKKGKEVKEAKKGLREVKITSTIEEADLKEFSVVPFGATPGAGIVENVMRAYKEGSLEEKHRIQLNEEYQMRFDTRSHEPLIDEFLKSIGQKPTTNNKSGGQRMAVRNEHIKDLIDRAVEEKNTDQADALDQLAAERDEYFEELERLHEEYGDDEGNIDQTFIRLNETIDELRADGSKKSEIEKEYEQILATARQEAIRQYDRKTNFQASPVEKEQMEQRLESTDSYYSIITLRDAWKESADAQFKYTSRKTRDTFEDRTDQDTSDKYKRARVSA